MSRSGYSDDCDDNWSLIRWRGAVASAIRGKRGQAFLKEMLSALDEIPNKRLIEGELVAGGEVCALGAVGVKRAIPGILDIDPYDQDAVADIFGIPPALAREIMYINDLSFGPWVDGKPEIRWRHVREWVKSKIVQPTDVLGERK